MKNRNMDSKTQASLRETGERGDAAIMPGNSMKFDALLQESDHLHQSCQRVYGAIYTVFGVVTPGIIGIFLLIGKELQEPFDERIAAFSLVLIFCFGALWTNNLWMELFTYIRYRYLSLLPRLYEESNQGDQRNLVQVVTPRSLISWMPINFFNLGSVAVLVGVWWKFLLPEKGWLAWVGLSFLGAAAISVVLVVVEAKRLEKEILESLPEVKPDAI